MKISKPVFSEEIERSAVSKVFQNPKRFLPKVRKLDLKPEHFFSQQYREIFCWAIERFEKGESFERRVLVRDFLKTPINEQIGDDTDLLSDLLSYRMDEYSSFDEIIERVKADAALRIASKAALDISEGIHTKEPQDVVKSLSEAIESISSISRTKNAGYEAEIAVQEFQNELKRRYEGKETLVVPTGVIQIDDITNGGFRNGELIVISAQTSGGKSVLSLQSAIPSIKEGKRVLIFSMEMGVKEVVGRLVSAIGDVPMSAIIRPASSKKEDLAKMKKAMKILQESKIKIFDNPSMTTDFIESQCEDSDEVDLVVVDYVQLIESVNKGKESREQEVARISKKLKQLAKKLDCPVVTPSQINDDGKLRESRAIGHDADIVLTIWETGINVTKNRNGKSGVTLPLQLNGLLQKFETINISSNSKSDPYAPKRYEKFDFVDSQSKRNTA